MTLLPNERREWDKVRRLGKKHGLPVKRVGPANVVFPALHHSLPLQLGTGSPTTVMKARVELKKKGYMFKEQYQW